MIERMRMFSVRPGTPGARQQKPRTIRSIGTPACEARDSSAHISGSSSWFIFATIRAGRPASVILDLALDQLDELGAHVHRRDEQRRERRRPRAAGQEVEQRDDVAGDRRVGREQPDVLVEPRRARVVVAGRDVRVAAHAVVLLADDERGLAVGLQAADAEDDVRADLLELPRPVQVPRLVEARVQLDHAGDLLAGLGGADQRLDERRVVADPVDGHLDRDASAGRRRPRG